jgi:cellobiose-specific phosphotransferase system component IIB
MKSIPMQVSAENAESLLKQNHLLMLVPQVRHLYRQIRMYRNKGNTRIKLQSVIAHHSTLQKKD